MTPLFDCYAEHLAELQARHERLMLAGQLDALFIHAGSPLGLFRDDQQYPFKASPYFKAWLPLVAHPHCALLIRPGRTPRLYYYNPEDFWHLPAGEPEGEWVRHFEVRVVGSPDAALREVTSLSRWAYVGPEPRMGDRWGATALNPEALLSGLDYARARKTRYEQAALQAANRLAVRGHRAAHQAFLAGESEYAIQHAYLLATGQREAQMPYSNIVALNEHCAVLHYQHYLGQAPAAHHSLLVDAGAEVGGYAADITRTYSGEAGVFQDLINALESLQQELCAEARVGVDFVALHRRCYAGVATILHESGLVRLSVEEQLDRQLPRFFFPHGLGHLLGLQVHDAGGFMRGPEGGHLAPPDEHPFLRLTRKLESGMVITIEPGLYFIPSLLEALRATPSAERVDWALIERLRPCGGIRIEDNLLIETAGTVNMTREAFAGLGS